MQILPFTLLAAAHVGVAFLGGLAVGIERERSGGPTHPRFGGVRTFALLGLVSGVSGWLWVSNAAAPAVVLLAASAALVVVAYANAARVSLGATTEVAAIVVLAAGLLAGSGELRVASAIFAATVLLLVEKQPLHGMASVLQDVEIRAGARFAVMAIVVLPLVPAGPYGPYGGIHPHQLWILVLLLSGLSFAGYVARRLIGNARGYALSGLLGGLVSSTSVTLSLANVSRRDNGLGRSLAAGALGASVVMLPRMLLLSALIFRPLAHALWPWLIAPAVLGLGLASQGLRADRAPKTASKADPHGSAAAVVGADENPLGVGAAVKLALLFQAVLYLVAFARAFLGSRGLYATTGLVGLTEVDALTISIAQNASTGLAVEIAARAVLIGALANTLTKIAITLFIGRGTFRTLATLGLTLMALTLGAALYAQFR